MNKNIEESISFIKQFKKLVKNVKNTEIVICATFTSLCEMKKALKGTNIKLGAQNMYFEEKGAFTGEISPLMLKDTGCEYVILGHSERRQYFNESDDLINKKIKSTLKNELKAILCIGETLEQRNDNETIKIIKNQLMVCLKDISGKDIKNIVVAYEPIWAIGTGKNATSLQAEEVHNFIRELLSERYNSSIAKNARIIYGGSVKPDNAAELMSQQNVDGALVGGASLKVDDFVGIINHRR